MSFKPLITSKERIKAYDEIMRAKAIQKARIEAHQIDQNEAEKKIRDIASIFGVIGNDTLKPAISGLEATVSGKSATNVEQTHQINMLMNSDHQNKTNRFYICIKQIEVLKDSLYFLNFLEMNKMQFIHETVFGIISGLNASPNEPAIFSRLEGCLTYQFEFEKILANKRKFVDIAYNTKSVTWKHDFKKMFNLFYEANEIISYFIDHEDELIDQPTAITPPTAIIPSTRYSTIEGLNEFLETFDSLKEFLKQSNLTDIEKVIKAIDDYTNAAILGS